MDEMHAWAVAQGAASIELNVYEFNQNAIRFYQNLGFQTFSRKMRKKL
jgi:diamine N-acetyltransferase